MKDSCEEGRVLYNLSGKVRADYAPRDLSGVRRHDVTEGEEQTGDRQTEKKRWDLSSAKPEEQNLFGSIIYSC